MIETKQDPEVVLGQFNKLMQELLRGRMNRNCFRPWEIGLLIDIEECNLRDSNRREILRRYQRAVHREFERGSLSLLKLSDYLNRSRRKASESEEQSYPREQAATR
jgi:hypothetical protein